MKRLAAVFTAVLLTIGLLAAPPPAPAAAAPRDIDNSSQESVRNAYLNWLWPALQVPREWDGDPSKCVSGTPGNPPAAQPAAAVGTYSPAAQAAALEALNYFREMAGLRPVTEHLAGSELARQAALIMRANNTLTHNPTPDMACYSLAGARGAAISNLSLGSSGARAIRALIDDYGEGNKTVGHRRWLLNPPLSAAGLGSTYSSSGVSIQGDDGSTRANSRPAGATPWPSAGFVPWEIMPTSGRWSYSAPGVNFISATVTMKKNGSPWAVQPISWNGPYGDPALVWQSNEITAPAIGAIDTYDITIDGIPGSPINYQVKTFRAGVTRVGSVTVSGDPTVGNTLTATAHDPYPTDADVYVSYAWYADGVQVGEGATYVVDPEDVGKQLVAKATASMLDIWASSTTSSSAMTVKPGVLKPEGVGIDGRPVVGESLSFREGFWGHWATFDLQWLRDGKAIPGAASYNYRLTSADLGAKIALRVTGSAPGYTSATVTTSALGPVTQQVTTPSTKKFTKIPTPTVSGTAQVGKTLTAKPGSWSPVPTSLTYQWYRSGKAITGATGRTYALAPSTKDGTITVRVTAARSGYTTTTSKPSKATKKVKAGTITAVKPKISGTARVGSTLTAVPGKWKPATTTFSYQWYRNSSKITKATKSTYLLAKADKGKKISVKVTGKAPGYTTKSMTSSKTAKVAG